MACECGALAKTLTASHITCHQGLWIVHANGMADAQIRSITKKIDELKASLLQTRLLDSWQSLW